ncbi:MetS family NSS transporter small subunit [Fervidicola ferrireducens]
MRPGSIITMIVMLTIVWGGLFYFLNMALKSEKK